MRINGSHGLGLSILRQLSESQKKVTTALARLSGQNDSVSIFSQKLNSQIRAINQGLRNINDSRAVLSITDAGLEGLTDIVQRMRELSVQASSSLISADDRANISSELQTLASEYDRVVETTEFNGNALLSESSLSSTIERDVGTGQFTMTSTTVSAGGAQRGIATGDFDYDGDLDAVTMDRGSNYAKIYLNNGSGVMSLAQCINMGGVTNRPTVGDVDGDGIIDILMPQTASSNLTFLKGDGSGSFYVAQTLSNGSTIFDSRLFDMDGDGDNDIIATSNGSALTSFFRNKGDGTFEAAATISTVSAMNGIDNADLDDDGDEDLVLTSGGANYIYTNDGAGNFSLLQTYVHGGTAGKSRLRDLNNDGKVDIVWSEEAGSIVSRLGNGDGTFGSAITSSLGTASPRDFNLADFNGDGILDVVASYSLTSNNNVMLGNGNGSFTLSATLSGFASTAFAVTAGDFTGDGIADILASNETYLSVFTGNKTEQSARSFLNVSSAERAQTLIGALDNALENLMNRRSNVGIELSQLDFEESYLRGTQEALQNQEDSDDIAMTVAELTKAQIQQQAQLAALTQLNLQQKMVLDLLKF